MFTNSIVVLDFPQNALLRAAVCAELSHDKKLCGAALFIQTNPNDAPQRATETVIKDLFDIKINPTQLDSVYALHINPLPTPLLIDKDLKAKYLFPNKKLCYVTRIEVVGELQSSALTIKLTGTKNAQQHEDEIKAPKEFIDTLRRIINAM